MALYESPFGTMSREPATWWDRLLGRIGLLPIKLCPELDRVIRGILLNPDTVARLFLQNQGVTVIMPEIDTYAHSVYDMTVPVSPTTDTRAPEECPFCGDTTCTCNPRPKG
jgi:hypothetical protein